MIAIKSKSTGKWYAIKAPASGLLAELVEVAKKASQDFEVSEYPDNACADLKIIGEIYETQVRDSN